MKTVLVVEDEYAIAQMIFEVLKDEGYEVLLAMNGVEGLRCLTQSIPDVIVTDIMMPIMDGLTFCREVQAQPDYKAIPVIILSAVSKHSSISNCEWAAVINKPFNIDELLETLTQVVDW